MAMVVQHNITAMNANRQLGVTTGQQAKSSEKLSSGYRINRAGDDAAGLKISEKMRSQVRGLTRASSNAQDGVSLIQTAEGALNEAHSILQRMNELAVQGANDTNETIDRAAINQELTALTMELDRISETTQFNKQNLLDGSFQSKNLHVGANANQNITISIDNMNAETLGLKSINYYNSAKAQTGIQITGINYKEYSYKYDDTTSLAGNKSAAQKQFADEIASKAGTDEYIKQTDEKTGSVYYVANKDWTGSTVASAKRHSSASAARSVDVSAAQSKMFNEISNNLTPYLQKENTVGTKVPVYTSGAMSAKKMDSPNVDSYEKANATLLAVQDAINKVSSQRSALGALQNRLEHTIANLDNVAENTQAAESRIRDTDMASEMVEDSKNNILAQAGQSMLAQSNQSTQGVLSLLG